MNISHLPNWFRQLPMGQQVIAQADADVAAARQVHIDAIEALQQQQVKMTPALNKAVDDAQTAVKAAEQKLEAARTKHRQAIAERAQQNNTIEAAIDRHRAELAATADDAIEDFRREMEAELQRTRKAGFDTIEGMQTVRGVPQRIATSNATAIRAKIVRLCDITREGIPALRLLPATEIADAMQALRDSIPATHEVWDDPTLARQLSNPKTVVADDAMSV